MTTNNKPAFEIFVVREGSNKKSYFTKIGAAWPTKSGSGYNADLIGVTTPNGKNRTLRRCRRCPEAKATLQNSIKARF